MLIRSCVLHLSLASQFFLRLASVFKFWTLLVDVLGTATTVLHVHLAQNAIGAAYNF